LEYKEVVGKIKFKTDHTEKASGGMDWIRVAQDTDNLRAVVNTVMNLQLL
jgi:hypothetical protein